MRRHFLILRGRPWGLVLAGALLLAAPSTGSDARETASARQTEPRTRAQASSAQPQAALDSIRLRAAFFDPLVTGPPALPGPSGDGIPLRAAGADPYRLVQFEEAVTARVRARLERRDVEIVDTVPPRTLVVRLPPGGVDLHAIGGIRWVGPIQPGYKLSDELQRLLDSGGAATTTLALDVTLFRGETAAWIAPAVAQRFETARLVSVQRREPSRVSFEVAPTEAAALVGALTRDHAVAFVSVRHPLVPHNDHAVWIGQSYDAINGPQEAAGPDPKLYPLSASIWNRGLRGEGQVVAVADTGLEHEMCFFTDPLHPVNVQNVAPPEPLALDPGHRKVLAVNAPLALALEHDDSFRHGTHVAASAVGDDLAHGAGGFSAGHDHGDGMAPAAKLIFEDVSGSLASSCTTQIVVLSILDLFEQEYASGARISSNSWGSAPGGEDVVSFEAETGAFALEDLLVVVSAGNDGGSGIGGLAICKNCLTVGAAENYDADFADALGGLDPENMTEFSSRGPASDGRIKPDVVAPGFRVDSARFPVAYNEDEGDPACDPLAPDVCFPSFGGCYRTDTTQTCHVATLQGTSQATPLAAGLAALARQYFTDGFHPSGELSPPDSRTPTAALLKAVMINGARNMTGRRYTRGVSPIDFGPLEDAPSGTQGWGRVMLEDVLYFSGDSRRLRVVDLRHEQGLATGESVWQTFLVTSSDEPLKATLVWSDPSGSPLAAGPLVNDLDLLLTAPDGAVYLGNQWTDDEVEVAGDKRSRADPSGKDAVNNVEGVLLPEPTPGLYRIEARGFDVPGGAESVTQGLALVWTGAVADCATTPAPANPTVSDVGSSHVELAWDPVPNSAGYEVLRNATGCREPMVAEVVLPVPAGQTAFVDATLSPATAYHYTVRARVGPEGCETADTPCLPITTLPAPAGPPPVPDGVFGSPMTARRANASGTELRVAWDVSGCPAAGYHLLHGPLDAVASLEPGAARCDLATTGLYSWSSVPAGDVWFLVVADDRASTEGSWGTDSAGLPRAGSIPSSFCSLNLRDNSGTCD